MASEMLSLLIWANVTLGVGILIVLGLRVPVRRLAGAHVAYALWLLPLIAFLAWLAPARQITLVLPATSIATTVDSASAMSASDMPTLFIVLAWFVGVAGMMTLFTLRQRIFVRSAGSLEPVTALGHGVFSAAPSHGPAVVGALRPIILLPRDFDTRFSAEERTLVLAHEKTHLDRFDPLVNAAAMGLRAINWFNPLVHVASHALRIDQELACDASVLARHTNSQRAYAEAMLKSHTAAFHVPVGCAWHTPAFHSLKERILMLKCSPSRLGRGLGLSLLAVAALSVCGAVWLMRPAEVLAAAVPEEPASVVDAEPVVETPEVVDMPGIVETVEGVEPVEDVEPVEQIDPVEEVEDVDEVEALGELDTLDELEALGELDQEAREAHDDVQQATRHALREARAAIAAAQKHTAKESAMAMKAARAAIADARLAMLEAEPAIAAAREAIKSAQPAIAAAHREAAKAAHLANVEARKARAQASAAVHLAAACQRARVRKPSQSAAREEELRALEKLVCIPRHLGEPSPAPQPQD